MKSLPGNGALRNGAEVRKEIRALIRRVGDEDKDALQELRQLASAYPDAMRKELSYSINHIAVYALAMVVFKDDGEAQDGLVASIRLLADELAGADPTPARRICAEVASLAVHEHWHASSSVLSQNQGKPTVARCRTEAQKRALRSLLTLSQIEKAERRRARMVDVQWRQPLMLEAGPS
jgi:hypothetical protein